jgi:uncharacterized membrane protein
MKMKMACLQLTKRSYRKNAPIAYMGFIQAYLLVNKQLKALRLDKQGFQ